MKTKSEQELSLWYGTYEARLGLSGSGMDGDGGSIRPWDEARSAHAHGFHVGEDGDVYATLTGRTGRRHREELRKFDQISSAVKMLPFETERLLRAAFDTCGASRFTANYFSAESVAPLVGLAVVMWFEAKPDETRAPHAVIDRWDADLHTYESEAERGKRTEVRRQAERVLAPIRRKTLAVYGECLDVYEAIRLHITKERREERAIQIAKLRSG